MTEELTHRTCIITGAAQGIGRAIVERCISMGANVVGVDLNEAALKDAFCQLPKDRVMLVAGTVMDPDVAERAVSEAVARFGDVYALVNNAGIIRPALIEKMTDRQWQEVIDVHLTGSFYWTRSVGKHFVSRAKTDSLAGGAIVNISSEAGRKGSIGQINYAAAKAGLLGMTMSAAREWGRYNVRVNSVCFGVVETSMTEVLRGEKFRDSVLNQIPLGRFGETDEVVRAVCFLLSDSASYITGQHLGVSGGFHISI